MKSIFNSIVVGAGQAGLASAYYLQKQSLNYLVLESSNQTAGSWPNYYDSLTLFSPARYSSLPGLPFPGAPNRYPTKQEVVSYLIEYVDHFNLNVRTGEKLVKVSKVDDVFEIITSTGNVFHARTIISATGAFSYPHIPQIDGKELFKGTMIHSSQYKNIEEFKNKRIIIVGGGNSAVQIAFELSQVSNVSIASRSPISFIPQKLLGKDVHFWLKVTGVDRFSLFKDLSMNTSVLDTGVYRQAILQNRPDRRPMFISFTKEGVIWENEIEEKVDTVIFATGYRPNVMYLKSLKGALDSSGNPIHDKGVSQTVRGLYYVGLSGQRTFSSATIRGVGPDAKYVIKRAKGLVSRSPVFYESERKYSNI